MLHISVWLPLLLMYLCLFDNNSSLLKPSHIVLPDSITSNNFIIYDVSSVFHFLFLWLSLLASDSHLAYLLTLTSSCFWIVVMISKPFLIEVNASSDSHGTSYWIWKLYLSVCIKNVVRNCSETPGLITITWKEVNILSCLNFDCYGSQAFGEPSRDKVCFQLRGVREIEIHSFIKLKHIVRDLCVYMSYCRSLYHQTAIYCLVRDPLLTLSLMKTTFNNTDLNI